MDHLSDEYIESVDMQSLTAFTGQSRAFCDPHTTFSTFGFASFMMITVQLVINIITGKQEPISLLLIFLKYSLLLLNFFTFVQWCVQKLIIIYLCMSLFRISEFLEYENKFTLSP